jgi:hypothetical protein
MASFIARFFVLTRTREDGATLGLFLGLIRVVDARAQSIIQKAETDLVVSILHLKGVKK